MTYEIVVGDRALVRVEAAKLPVQVSDFSLSVSSSNLPIPQQA